MHLTHWGPATHICVSKLTIIASDNGLSPGQRQAIIWTNAGILLIGLLGPNYSEILIEIQIFSYMKMHLKMPSAKWSPFCVGLNVLNMSLTQQWPLHSGHNMPTWKLKTAEQFVLILSDKLSWINILRPQQNGRHFTDDIFKCISFNENIWILNKISLKYVP